MIFEVSTPGLLTTIQDLGRWGYQGKGMPVAGAMDPQALKIGNILVGNDPHEAALEITVMGPTLTVVEGHRLRSKKSARSSISHKEERVDRPYCWNG